MAKSDQMFLDGLLEALVVVAGVIGKRPIKGMSDGEWKLINEINMALTARAAKEAERLFNAGL